MSAIFESDGRCRDLLAPLIAMAAANQHLRVNIADIGNALLAHRDDCLWRMADAEADPSFRLARFTFSAHSRSLYFAHPETLIVIGPDAMTEDFSYDDSVDPVKTYERAVAPDKAFYDRVIATKESGTRTLVYEDLNEPHTGNAYRVKPGQVIRMEQRPSLHNGRTQIIDVLWVTPDLEQWSDHLNTGALEGLNPKLYSGIWTQSGYLQKIATCVADEFPYELLEHDMVSHMFFAAHCNADWILMTHGEDDNVNSCHENFLHGFARIPAIQAIEDETERNRVIQFFSDRNDVNMFQGQQFVQDERGITRCKLFPSPPVPEGTAVEWYSEMDTYVVISNCPYADQALPFPEARPNPVYISVWDTGIEPQPQQLVKPGAWHDTVAKRIASKDLSPK